MVRILREFLAEVEFPGGMRVPVNPSKGLIATTPAEMQQTASDSGPYGGDIDMQELMASSMIRLTVFVAGGLLGRGDCHVVMGDGAVGGDRSGVHGEWLDFCLTPGRGWSSDISFNARCSAVRGDFHIPPQIALLYARPAQ